MQDVHDFGLLLRHVAQGLIQFSLQVESLFNLYPVIQEKHYFYVQLLQFNGHGEHFVSVFKYDP
jgi:hypothetical protein